MSRPNDTNTPYGITTRLAHAGRHPDEQFGFVNTPIYRGSTVLYPTVDAINKRAQRYTYGTKGTPTADSLNTAWAEISGVAGSVAVPSGLAAVALALLCTTKAGDHVLTVSYTHLTLPTKA